MAKESGQKAIGRVRPPRVQIEYVDPSSNKKIELPFVMGVLADLSGNTPGHGDPNFTTSAIDHRKFVDIDIDNFDERMRARDGFRPGVTFNVKSRLSADDNESLHVKLDFKSMDDFSPAAVAKQVPALAELLNARQRLANLRAYVDGKDAAGKNLLALLSAPDKLSALNEFLAATNDADANKRR